MKSNKIITCCQKLITSKLPNVNKANIIQIKDNYRLFRMYIKDGEPMLESEVSKANERHCCDEIVDCFCMYKYNISAKEKRKYVKKLINMPFVFNVAPDYVLDGLVVMIACDSITEENFLGFWFEICDEVGIKFDPYDSTMSDINSSKHRKSHVKNMVSYLTYKERYFRA